ncbi:MAG: hypothetical protein J3Q66DRAFT_62619 [Benniella sp.]|nr:MAG: hypothetical protein J3Q66DRAFT_62619 [Benniella sp.]
MCLPWTRKACVLFTAAESFFCPDQPVTSQELTRSLASFNMPRTLLFDLQRELKNMEQYESDEGPPPDFGVCKVWVEHVKLLGHCACRDSFGTLFH